MDTTTLTIKLNKIVIDNNEEYSLKDYSEWLSELKIFDAEFNNTSLNRCMHCSNHPNNGGSGVCHCIIPSMDVIY